MICGCVQSLGGRGFIEYVKNVPTQVPVPYGGSNYEIREIRENGNRIGVRRKIGYDACD